MLLQVTLGSILIVVTTFVHAGCTLAAVWALTSSRFHRWSSSRWRRVSLTAMLVLLMFFAAFFEASIWAGVFLAVGALGSLEQALYFSTVTFTTLGYGDVILDPDWRLLASFEAANGTIMFGWTTALIFAFVHRAVTHDEALTARLER